MYNTILVGIDGSDEATGALEHAIDLADAVGATLHVVSVVETTGSSMRFGVTEVDELNRAVSELVDDVVDAHASQTVEITGDIRRGRPAESLLEYASEHGVDLILVGQHGSDGLASAILGSTTDRLARLTEIPMTIVPGQHLE